MALERPKPHSSRKAQIPSKLVWAGVLECLAEILQRFVGRAHGRVPSTTRTFLYEATERIACLHVILRTGIDVSGGLLNRPVMLDLGQDAPNRAAQLREVSAGEAPALHLLQPRRNSPQRLFEEAWDKRLADHLEGHGWMSGLIIRICSIEPWHSSQQDRTAIV